MAPKSMKVVVQKKGKHVAAPKKPAASSMTALTEWAKGKSDDEMGLGSDDDTIMKKPSSSTKDKNNERRDRNKDYHFQKQLSSMPKPVVELWKSGKTSERTAMVNILMEEKSRGHYEPNFSKPQFQDQPSVLIIIMCCTCVCHPNRITRLIHVYEHDHIYIHQCVHHCHYIHQ